MVRVLDDNPHGPGGGSVYCRASAGAIPKSLSKPPRRDRDAEDEESHRRAKDEADNPEKSRGKLISMEKSNVLECTVARGECFMQVKVPKWFVVISLILAFFIMAFVWVLVNDPQFWMAKRPIRKDKLWFAPFFHHELNHIALGEFRRRIAEGPDKTPQVANEVCPVILSAANRPEPHWAWLTATILRSHGFCAKNNVQFSQSVSILARPGGTFASIDHPIFTKSLVESLKDAGVIRIIEEDHVGRMPPDTFFEKPLIGATSEQTKHFVLQLLDHAKAWEMCRMDGCQYCLVLEDDAIMSRRIEASLQVRNDAIGTFVGSIEVI